MTLFDSLLKYSDCNHNAIYFENKKISFKELVINVKKMINYLKQSGIKENDVVTIVLPNLPVTVYLFYALNAMGAIQNIVHPLTPFLKVIESMKLTDSKKVILLETVYQDNIEDFKKYNYDFFFANPMYDKSSLMKNLFYLKYKKAKKQDNIYKVDDFRKYEALQDYKITNENKDAIYLHSGGTTGVPKIIALSNDSINNLASKVSGIIKQPIYGKSMLAVLPSFHGFGLGMGIHSPLYNGAASALMMKFNSTKVIKWINQNKVNLMIGVPLLYQKLLKDEKFKSCKLSNLTHCFIGGDNVLASLLEQFNQVMKENNSFAMLLEGYGLTETVTVCSVNTKESFKIGSVGKPLNGIEIVILDENQNQLLANKIGEVYVAGDTLMNKYLNDIEATKNTMVNINNKTYIKTGDLGYLDSEGFLFLKGRMKRMFKVSGINVYPSEIEKIATDNKHVHDAALEYFSSPKPHMVLFVIKNNKSSLSNDEIKKIILEDLSKKVLKYSMPSKIIFMDEFPKTNVGKIDHKAFKDVGE